MGDYDTLSSFSSQEPLRLEVKVGIDACFVLPIPVKHRETLTIKDFITEFAQPRYDRARQKEKEKEEKKKKEEDDKKEEERKKKEKEKEEQAKLDAEKNKETDVAESGESSSTTSTTTATTDEASAKGKEPVDEEKEDSQKTEKKQEKSEKEELKKKLPAYLSKLKSVTLPDSTVIKALFLSSGSELDSDDLVYDVIPPPSSTHGISQVIAVVEGQSFDDVLKLISAAQNALYDGITETQQKGFSVIQSDEHEGALITIDDSTLNSNLRSILKQHDSSYDTKPQFSAETLLAHLEELKNPMDTYQREIFSPLVEYLETLYTDVIEKLNNLTKEKKITYNTLWHIFKKDVCVYGYENGDENMIYGFKIEGCHYFRGMFPCFEIKGSVVQTDGSKFGQVTKAFYISEFRGTKDLDSLNVRVIDEKVEAMLVERGRKFKQYSLGNHYSGYKGNMFSIGQWGSVLWFKADGRVMVDGTAFNRFNPNYTTFRLQSTHHSYGYYADSSKAERSAERDITPERLFSTWPTVPGFSFPSKRWGEILVSNIEPVVFDENAFTRLVLPEAKKKLVKALVENSRTAFSDIISGKGAGCIFLLHGSPGVGKTLTAEAIAEMLHRPLYSVSVGELGTDTNTLEQNLGQILEVAAGWNAVILIDEADIFLEARTEHDIVRNAMVGIFLKLLEYHQGVLFLTTNRVKCFDEAFHSRISVALRYDDLNSESRKKVWSNLLEAADIGVKGSAAGGEKGVDVEKLSEVALNGRQIRSVIRLAQALATSQGDDKVTNEHVSECVAIARIGTADFLSKGPTTTSN